MREKSRNIVVRAFGAYELGVLVKFNQEQINEALKQEYDSRLKKHGISTDPKMIPDGEWIDDVTKWPDVDDGKLFGYILQVKAVETDYIGVYKDQKTYSYWMSSFVGTVWHNTCLTNKNMCRRLPFTSGFILRKAMVSSPSLHHGVLALPDRERPLTML